MFGSDRLGGLDRRQFLRSAAGASLALSGLRSAFAGDAGSESPRRTPTDLVPLGKTGISMSRVGIGTGTRGYNRSSNQTRMGFEKFVPLIRHAFDAGVRFFDCADLYGSHIYVREALRSIPREKVTILTKVWWRHGESPKTIVDRFLDELGLHDSYIDIVLLHCVTDADWDKKLTPYMDMLSELKARKKIRAVGTSCHSLEGLKTTAASPWADVVLARINPKGVKMDGQPDQVVAQVVPVLKQMHEAGKGVLGMKVFGEGQLAKESAMREECLRFVWGLGCVDATTIGFESPQQIDDTMKILERVL
jgi:aryl-alcohol dehydrogenase-like predicted oxidoreductase